MAEHPELESKPYPKRKKQAGYKLTDVRCDAKILFHAQNDTESEKIVDSHERDKPHDFAHSFTFACFIAKYPVLIYYKKYHVCQNAWYR